jgi:hypothetical protein
MNALLVRFFAMAAIVAPTIADAATLLPAYTFPDGSAGFEFLICGTARGARSFSIDFTRVDGAFICTALKHGT